MRWAWASCLVSIGVVGIAFDVRSLTVAFRLLPCRTAIMISMETITKVEEQLTLTKK